jgi:protein-L-isoaspartate(D-aspartate) O-methyltransferase
MFVPELVALQAGERPKTLVCDIHRPAREALEYVYDDRPVNQVLRLPHGITRVSNNTMPSLTAQALASLEINEGHRVLEIGAGTGYAAALLGRLVGPTGSVFSVEIVPRFAEIARIAIAQLGLENVTIVEGDGVFGYPAAGIYDRVLASVSFRELPRAWLDQLVPNGKVAIPLRLIPGKDVLVVLNRQGQTLKGQGVCACGFQPLLSEEHFQLQEWVRADSDSGLRSLLEKPSEEMGFVGGIVRDEEEAYYLQLWLGLHEEWSRLVLNHQKNRAAHIAVVDPDRRSLAAWWVGERQIRFYGQSEARERFLRAYDRWAQQGRPGPCALRMHASWEEIGDACSEAGRYVQMGSATCRFWFETGGQTDATHSQ